MKIHFIQHENYESPAAIEQWATAHNHQSSYTKDFLYEKLPEQIDNIDMLIIMGGPQSPSSSLEEFPYFNGKAEISFIKQAIRKDKIVFGICLGSQLIGEAMGAKTEHSPNKEIGNFKIHFTENAIIHPVFSQFPSELVVGHWHGDMPGLTDNCEILAYSEGCPRQIIKYAPKVYAFQNHWEFTKEAVNQLIIHSEKELAETKYLPYVQTKNEILNYNYNEMNQYLFRFLDYISSL